MGARAQHTRERRALHTPSLQTAYPAPARAHTFDLCRIDEFERGITDDAISNGTTTSNTTSHVPTSGAPEHSTPRKLACTLPFYVDNPGASARAKWWVKHTHSSGACAFGRVRAGFGGRCRRAVSAVPRRKGFVTREGFVTHENLS